MGKLRAVAADQVAETAEHSAEVPLHVFLIAPLRGVDPIRESGERQGLEPDATGTGQGRAAYRPR